LTLLLAANRVGVKTAGRLLASSFLVFLAALTRFVEFEPGGALARAPRAQVLVRQLAAQEEQLDEHAKNATYNLATSSSLSGVHSKNSVS
jgi:hypothetical protein